MDDNVSMDVMSSTSQKPTFQGPVIVSVDDFLITKWPTDPILVCSRAQNGYFYKVCIYNLIQPFLKNQTFVQESIPLFDQVRPWSGALPSDETPGTTDEAVPSKDGCTIKCRTELVIYILKRPDQRPAWRVPAHGHVKLPRTEH
ncbi:uncharacterized protein LOC117318935 [Pecten maximus]|uniref:uncharacterized protein LOC117318935 n=1 Tax=Pecten maximus TaxID=6579 RepID=UPI0014588D71|nr:uncharacterized protein LOC117318935 [Pecten maximus]